MERLTHRNCKIKTGYSLEEILELSGIYGIHTQEELESCIYRQIDFDGSRVSIEFETNLLEEFQVRIDIHTKIIKDESFKSTGIKNGLSFPWVCAQVDAALKHGFHNISIDAFGDSKKWKKYTGYIVWGKYGFLMSDPQDIEDFQNTMRKLKSEGIIDTEFETLYDLLCSKDGCGIWQEHGKNWLGEFSLKADSDSLRILDEVKNLKKRT